MYCSCPLSINGVSIAARLCDRCPDINAKRMHSFCVSVFSRRYLLSGREVMYWRMMAGSYMTVCLGRVGRSLNIAFTIFLVSGWLPKVKPSSGGRMAESADLATATLPCFACSLLNSSARKLCASLKRGQ